MRLAEAARQLGLSPKTLRNQIAAGRLRGYKRFGAWHVRSAEVDRYARESLGRPGRRTTAKR